MGNRYTHLTYEQRQTLKELLDQGISKRAIAERMNVHISTIYREIDRGKKNGAYDPNYAEGKYQRHLAEKGPTAILDSDAYLSQHIADLILNEGLSPERIVEHLKQEAAPTLTSPQTIYTGIDAGRIPGVTRETLRQTTSTLFSDGQICIPKWVREKLDLHDGDVLSLEVTEDGRIIYQKQ